VPKDLRQVVGRTELRYTLRTGFLGIAKQKSRFLAGQIQFIFQSLRRGLFDMGKLSEDQVQQLVRLYIRQSVERLDKVFEVDDDQQRPYDDPESLQGYINGLSVIREDLIHNLSLGDFSMLENAIETFLKENGVDEVDKQSPAYRRLCIEVHKAETQLIPIQQQHMKCDFSYRDQLPKMFPEVFGKREETPAPEPREGKPPKQPPVVKISQVYAEYWQETEPAIKMRSRPEYKRALDHFVDFVGKDTDIKDIDAEVIRKYKQKLMKEEIAPGKVRAASTINNKYLGMAKGLLSHAEKEQYIDKNPAKGILVKEGKKKRPHELRDPFTEDELKKMFCGSPEYGEDRLDKASSFWLPIIALYTGMRLEEICQLYVSDVKEIDGVWGFEVVEDEDKEDKSVKTSEKRFVPLHPLLLQELNFLAYMNALPEQQGRVFPDLTRIGNRYGHHVSLWFKKFRESCGIIAPPRRKTFHSFRHTVVDHLLQKGASDIAVASLVGHAFKGVTLQVYKKPLRPKNVLEQAVLKLDYGIDLTHLKNSKWVVR
jgi:integrase